MHCPIFLLKLSLEGYGCKTKCNYKTKNPWEGLKTHFPDSTLLVQGQGRGGRQWWASVCILAMDAECTCGVGMEMTFHVCTKNWKKSSEKNFHYEIKENSCIKVQRGKATEQGWILINSGWCKAERVTPLGLEWNKRDRVSNKIKLKLLLSSTCSLQEFDQWLHSCFLIF